MSQNRHFGMDERGVALPTAMIALMVLVALTASFAALAATEPIVASNHLKTVRARSFAESGLERALWALSNPSATGGIPASPTTAVTPYDGGAFFTLSDLGGFTLQVTPGGGANERSVVAVGYTPTNDTSDPTPKGVRRIQATVMKIRTVDPPCALCVIGNVQVGGNARVDARGGACSGGSPADWGTLTTGTASTSGNGQVYGYGNDTYNDAYPVGNDIRSDPTNPFSFKYTEPEIEILKSIAKKNGTYYTGTVTSLPASGGIVFVDTTTGNPYTSSTPDSEAGVLDVNGSPTWSGWVIVRGTIRISGSVAVTGLLYAQNDLSFGGNASVTGAVVSENRKYTSSTLVDSAADGTASITYNCQAVRDGGGTIPQGWFVKAGSYQEVANP